MTRRRLTKTERDAYREPFLDPSSRRPVAEWPREIPFDGEGPDDVHQLATDWWEWLQHSDTPKLLLHAKPGVIMKKKLVAELEAALPNLTSVAVGKGRHYIQEDQPDAIGRALSAWLNQVQKMPDGFDVLAAVPEPHIPVDGMEVSRS
jgi:haloalkane dehalogenase